MLRAEEFLTWLRATAFVPFRILMNSGRTYEVRHPELARALRGSVLLFTPTEDPDLYDRVEMIGLVLIERIEPLSAPAPAAAPGNGQ